MERANEGNDEDEDNAADANCHRRTVVVGKPAEGDDTERHR
jgi:hypothetical protein